MAQQQMVKDERSLGDLFSELAAESGTLIRQELALAQTELTQKAIRAGKGVGKLAIGGAIGFAGMLAMIAAAILLLAIWIPAWVSALIVGAVICGASFLIVTSALETLRNTDPVPHETIESIKEDAKWLKNEVKT